MHDEDNALGLHVTNPNNESWQMYGDKRLLSDVDKTNMTYCLAAVQASADEVYEAWKTGTIPPVESFQAWKHAPTLESARSDTQLVAPLFNFDNPPKRRADITQRCTSKYTLNYWYWSTLILIEKSGLWKYPISYTPDCKIPEHS
jgi:hypothetical protein